MNITRSRHSSRQRRRREKTAGVAVGKGVAKAAGLESWQVTVISTLVREGLLVVRVSQKAVLIVGVISMAAVVIVRW